MSDTRYEDYDLYGLFLKLVEQIPEGKVATYRSIASALGDRGAALACAYMQDIFRGADHPVYRLVSSDGNLGGYRTDDEKRQDSLLLRNEGLFVASGNVRDFSESLFEDFESPAPLEAMRNEQDMFSEEVSLEDDFDSDMIAAVDVSYDSRNGYACMFREESKEDVVSESVMDLRFPYIPGYLFYREYKFIKHLASRFNGTILIDGNGILHPRLFGLASSAGVFMRKATVGVAKSLLLGSLKDGRVLYSGREVGIVIAPRTIVSPGHRISLTSAAELLEEKYGRRYPSTLKKAHNGTVALRKRSYAEAMQR